MFRVIGEVHAPGRWARFTNEELVDLMTIFGLPRARGRQDVLNFMMEVEREMGLRRNYAQRAQERHDVLKANERGEKFLGQKGKSA